MEQLALELFPLSNEAYMNHTIYQPDGVVTPWAVHVEGWERQLDITVYHESLGKDGMFTFPNLRKIGTPEKFAQFVCKMIRTFQILKPGEFELRCIDVLALQNGYREGVEKAENIYVYCN